MRWFLLMFVGVALLGSGARGEEIPERFRLADGSLDLDKVVAHFEDLYRSTSSIAEARLTIERPRLQRSLRMKSWTEGKEKSLIVIQDPPRERGTATLKVEKNLWNYLPRIKRTIRIPPSMMLQSWMGSDFTNDDLVREASFSEDYTYELRGRIDEPDGWLIHFTAKPDIVGLWQRIELVVSPDGELPVHAKYFDHRGRLARTMSWDNVQEMDGRRLPTRMTLEPEGQENQRTILEYLSIDFDVEIPSSTFSLSELERNR